MYCHLILLELLDEGVHRLLRPLLLLVPLLPAQQLLDCGRGEGEQGVQSRHFVRGDLPFTSQFMCLSAKILKYRA